MHEAQQQQETAPAETAEKKTARAGRQRPLKFWALIKHRQVDLETNQPKPSEVLEFEDKAAMRLELANSAYETAEVRVIRGYEMNVKAKRNISIN